MRKQYGIIELSILCCIVFSQINIIAQKNKNEASLIKSLKWEQFSSYPGKKFFEEKPILNEQDSKMISLFLTKHAFDPGKYSQEPAFANYFKEYKKAKNEFERQRLVQNIKDKFELKQNDLASIDMFVTETSGELGNYSFNEKGFPLTLKRVGFLTLSWFGNFDVQIDNYSLLADKIDRTTFPNLIPVEEKSAERIVKSDPSRSVAIILIIKPLQGDDRFLNEHDYKMSPSLYGTALYCAVVIPTTHEVIGVFPNDETLNNQILKQLSNENRIFGNYYSSINDPAGINENIWLRASNNEITKDKNRLKELGLNASSLVDSLDNNIKMEITKREKIANEILERRNKIPVIYESFFYGKGTGNIQLSSFDGKKFTGTLNWPGNTNKIDGELFEDLLGPEIIMTETWSRSRKRTYTIRVKNDYQLYGTNEEITDRGKIYIDYNSN